MGVNLCYLVWLVLNRYTVRGVSFEKEILVSGRMFSGLTIRNVFMLQQDVHVNLKDICPMMQQVFSLFSIFEKINK